MASFDFTLPTAKLVTVCLILLLPYAHRSNAYVHDQILWHHTPKDCPCTLWTKNQSKSAAAMWESPEVRERAGTSCSLPANGLTPDPSLPEYSPQAGWCYCETSPWYTFCQPPAAFPSQINLLVVNATSVVVNFATFDGGSRSGAVVEAHVREYFNNRRLSTSFEGYSTVYKDSTSSRRISYHHVTLHSLKERTRYEYKVRVKESANATASQWSDWIDFKTLYSSGETRLAMYADMGSFASQFSKPSVPAMSRHNVGNLVDDLAKGKIDFAVHSGDLAYEFEVNGGARGDGFMDGYSEFLSHAPWAPGWGNHEYLEGDQGYRLANISAGLIAEKTNECARESLALLDRHRTCPHSSAGHVALLVPF